MVAVAVMAVLLLLLWMLASHNLPLAVVE